MTKLNKHWNYLLVFILGLLIISTTEVVAASSAKQLSKGIVLYNQNKDDKAMDYFLDVLVNGTNEEIEQANKYITLIHNRMGGIQTPVEVDVNFKEGEVRRLDDVALQTWQQAEQTAQDKAALIKAEEEAAAAQVVAKQQQALTAVNEQQLALTEQIEANKLAAQEQAEAYKSAVQDVNHNLANQVDSAKSVVQPTEPTVAPAEPTAIAPVVEASTTQENLSKTTEDLLQEEPEPSVNSLENEPTSAKNQVLTSTNKGSAFADLISPEAVEARELYTFQKIASMTDAVVQKINDTKGVNLYMRDDRPDAIDIEPEVIFDKNTFRTDALPLLNNIYELLALTQGSAYVILPPGSYTDDVTLSGIRQAMALNSYLINRGISQGKLHYNMGLVDEEPPARFANLHGLAVVFDYDTKLTTVMEKNESNETAPLLSMAIVPLCHAIDRSLGEAFAIDFSVLETENPLDNWVLQVVQHGHDGNFYIVRQLEGFSPVYHQILFNGRKGIIGPELPCGKYTLVLTGTDLKGKKQTLRRRVIVKCTDTKNGGEGSCSATKDTSSSQKELNYKATRLWTKPARTMYAVIPVTAGIDTSASVSTSTDSNTYTKTVNTKTIIEDDDGTDPLANVALTPANAQPYTEPLPANNPYDMPYESYNN